MTFKKLLFIIAFFAFKICVAQSPLDGGWSFGGTPSPHENYKGTTIIFSAINIPLTTINIINLCNKKGQNGFEGFIILSGIAQLITTSLYSVNSDKAYTVDNVLTGTAVIVTSSMSLILNKNKKSKISLNLNTLPIDNKTFVFGLRLTKQLD